MMRFSSLLFFTLTLALHAHALPVDTHTLEARQTCASKSGDAPYSLSCSAYTSAITCPNGIQGKKGGIVFLVHGTTSTGSETWQTGPYVQLLPSYGVGYDVCYVTIPGRSLEDIQVNSEYVAYNIGNLASRSSTGKIYIVGHSQGNLNIQWALDYWPSTRSLVTGFGSIAGDFFGTAEGPLACALTTLTSGGCQPSVIQQTVGSKFLTALKKRGGKALVSTLSLYTRTDDVIQPEVVNPTSALPGSSYYAVQDLCGPLENDDHFTMTVTASAYNFIADTIAHGGVPSRSRFQAGWCSYLTDQQPNPNLFTLTAGLIRQTFSDVLSLTTAGSRTLTEPALKSYVCAAGDATSCA